MTWCDMLMAHWPVEVDVLRGRIPRGLTLDTFRGRAWVGVVAFTMNRVRHRLSPTLPGVSSFAQVNVQTYVTAGLKSGVYLFSLDCESPLTVRVAKNFFQLPSHDARIVADGSDAWIKYELRRQDGAGRDAGFRVRYRGAGDPIDLKPGTFAQWLTNRFCVYSRDGQGRLLRGEVDHPAWQVWKAEVHMPWNRMFEPLELPISGEPVENYYSRLLDVVAWTMSPV